MAQPKLPSKDVKAFLSEVEALAKASPEIASAFMLVPKAAAKVGAARVCVKWGFHPTTGERICLKWQDA